MTKKLGISILLVLVGAALFVSALMGVFYAGHALAG
jgi:hypothetical protein